MSETPFASAVFVLHAIQPYAVQSHMGRAIRQCFFRLIHQINTQLVTQFHDGGHDLRPYTVSDLYRAHPSRHTITEGEQVWFRVTTLNSVLAKLLDSIAEEYVGTVIELDKANWQLGAILRDSHPWTGTTTDWALGARHMADRPRREITLQFALPTGFHSGGLTMPLPLPTLVFESLSKRWTAFNSASLPADLDSFIAHNVSIQAYRGETHRITLKNGEPELGFTGEVTYRIIGQNHALAKSNPSLSRNIEVNFTTLAQAVNMLSDFAFYSGVGIKTTVGMGMVCRF